MEPVVYKPSAFKHGVTAEQIACVLDKPRYEGPVEVYENKHIVLGFDRAGNLLEIMYNEMKDGGYNVFHAMPCRDIFFHLLPDEQQNEGIMQDNFENRAGHEMTDEEADYWDEFFTKNPPQVDPAKQGGYFTRQRELLDVLDKTAAAYILTRAEADRITPAQVISALVRKEIAAQAV
jgi:hypothetical protein